LFYWVLLYEIVLSVFFGLAVGFGASYLLKAAKKYNWTESESMVAFSIGLAVTVVGLNTLICCDELLCSFVCGVALSWDDWYHHEVEKAHFQEIIDNLLNYVMFIYIGVIIPWSQFNSIALNLSWWRLVLLAVFILIFRRPPFLLLFKYFIPALKNYREALFAGWFGPIGVAAVFYATLAISYIHLDDEENERVRNIVFPIVLFLVFFVYINTWAYCSCNNSLQKDDGIKRSSFIVRGYIKCK